MYESPITAYIEHTAINIADEINKKQEEYVYQRIMNLGIDIDKDELIKALNYDRNQYDKGYMDALVDVKELLDFFNSQSMASIDRCFGTDHYGKVRTWLDADREIILMYGLGNCIEMMKRFKAKAKEE